MPTVIAIQEAEIGQTKVGELQFKASPSKKVEKTPSQPIKAGNCGMSVIQLWWEV
jgi:hypothetical protein